MKNKKQAAPVFKPYVMDQMSLMPPSYNEMIPLQHMVRTINTAIDTIQLGFLDALYKGGGTSSYHPKMLLKVLVYAYSQKIYSSRKIAKALRENIAFLWLSGGNTPDFRTINAFRSSRLKAVIEQVFSAVVEYLAENGYVKLEHYFLDGTKIEANANKHKIVRAKSNTLYAGKVRGQVRDLLRQIEETNVQEQAEYGDADLEELGEQAEEDVNAERLKRKIGELNERLRQQAQVPRASRSALRKLEKECLPRLIKYEQQKQTLAGRNSYASSDPDATCMLMKEDRGARQPWPKPAYNVQTGTEGQYIVGYSVHGRTGDTSCFIPHLEQLLRGLKRLPRKIVADAGYGSEENYAYLEQQGAENYVKYNTFYQDTRRRRATAVPPRNKFRAENFGYDAEHDEFICPADKRLHFIGTGPYVSENGYRTERRHYQCHDCQDCPLKKLCTQAEGNRQVWISLKLMAYRRQARENLTSPEGAVLRAKRAVDVETVFGHLKQNMGIRRFMLRGLDKVKTEWGLASIAHNMMKLAAV